MIRSRCHRLVPEVLARNWDGNERCVLRKGHKGNCRVESLTTFHRYAITWNPSIWDKR